MALALAIFAATANATPEPSPAAAGAPEQAEARFKQAQELYRNGRFQESVTILLELRREFPDPILLYNLARAYEGLGDNQKAVEAYEQYSAEAPDSEDRGAIERRVLTLRRQLEEKRALEAERRRLANARKRQVPRAEQQADSGPGPWPWLLTGVGALGLGVGGAFALLAKQSENQARDEPAQRLAAADLERGQNQARVANVALIGGGIAVAAGVTWLLIGSEKSAGSSARLGLSPNGVLFLARGL